MFIDYWVSNIILEIFFHRLLKAHSVDPCRYNTHIGVHRDNVFDLKSTQQLSKENKSNLFELLLEMVTVYDILLFSVQNI